VVVSNCGDLRNDLHVCRSNKSGTSKRRTVSDVRWMASVGSQGAKTMPITYSLSPNFM